MILGYAGEPYLRFDDSGVYENIRSPAARLNRYRYPSQLTPRHGRPCAGRARARRALPLGLGYGDGTSAGQSGAVPAPFESAQLIRPSGGPLTNGLSGECAEM